MPLTPAAAHRKDLNAKPATMRHAHFRTIAAVIRTFSDADVGPIDPNAEGYGYEVQNVRTDVALAFASALAATNPRFDRARFLAACTSTEN